MVSENQPDAWKYPIGFLWDESRLVIERLNRALASEAVLFQAVVSTVMGGKKAHEAFNKRIDRLNGET